MWSDSPSWSEEVTGWILAFGRCIEEAPEWDAETFLRIRTVHVSSDVIHSSLKQLPDSHFTASRWRTTQIIFMCQSACQRPQNMLYKAEVQVWSGSGKERVFWVEGAISEIIIFTSSLWDLVTRLTPRCFAGSCVSAVFCLCWEVLSLLSMVVYKWRDDKLLTHTNIFINNIINFNSTCFMTLNLCQ